MLNIWWYHSRCYRHWQKGKWFGDCWYGNTHTHTHAHVHSTSETIIPLVSGNDYKVFLHNLDLICIQNITWSRFNWHRVLSGNEWANRVSFENNEWTLLIQKDASQLIKKPTSSYFHCHARQIFYRASLSCENLWTLTSLLRQWTFCGKRRYLFDLSYNHTLFFHH